MSQTMIQPAWVRVAHWVNALAIVLMAMSGWEVYDASPIFPPLRFPSGITLGGWLGGALQWHFAVMWVLFVNSLFYTILATATGHLRRKMSRVSLKSLSVDLTAALYGKLRHDDPKSYNAVQKLAYLIVFVDIVILIVSGLTLWKSVQFPILRVLMAGYDNARIVHFAAMSVLVAFFIVHVVMTALVPRALILMIRGR